MTREEVFSKLSEVFQDVFDDDGIVISEETKAEDIVGWNSLEHMNLLTAAEECFDIKFNMDEAAMMKNVGEMADMILKRMS